MGYIMKRKCYTNEYSLLIEDKAHNFTIKPSQGDGWIIRTPYGYIDYRHDDDNDVNEIWWVESHKKGHGSELIDLMQNQHPAGNIAWGATSISGEQLMNRWHNQHPDIQCITGDHEGQYNPFEHDSEPEPDEEYDHID